MKIGLYINEHYRPGQGPYKVYASLRKGLSQLGHEVLVNMPGDQTGCLHDMLLALGLAPQTLMGPNLFVLPQDRPEYFSKFRNFVVPSEWVRPIYMRTPLYKAHNIYVWSTGIDTELFNTDKQIRVDCLVYYKNRPEKELGAVLAMLKKFGQSYAAIRYGEYKEDEYRLKIQGCRYAVLLTNTESQGIGYMELLSTGTPCFVLDTSRYKAPDGVSYPATSVPYFTEICGKISALTVRYEDDFQQFLACLGQYAPRSYILEGHTLVAGAKKYLGILEEIG